MEEHGPTSTVSLHSGSAETAAVSLTRGKLLMPHGEAYVQPVRRQPNVSPVSWGSIAVTIHQHLRLN